MDYFRQHILSIVAFWPLAGMIVLMLFNKENKTLIRWWANLVMITGFVISLPLWFWFDRDSADQMQFVQKISWIPTIGANYHVGIDGISLLLVMLTTLLGPLAVLSSWEAIHDRVKEYYVFMLMLQAGMLGVFISLDFFLFYVFWEVMLVPMYFIIGVWGGQVFPLYIIRISFAAAGHSGAVLYVSQHRRSASGNIKPVRHGFHL